MADTLVSPRSVGEGGHDGDFVCFIYTNEIGFWALKQMSEKSLINPAPKSLVNTAPKAESRRAPDTLRHVFLGRVSCPAFLSSQRHHCVFFSFIEKRVIFPHGGKKNILNSSILKG